MPYVMSYDIQPLVTLREKAAFYEKAEDKNTYLLFEHDKDIALGQLAKNERGRFKINHGMQMGAVIKETSI